MSASSSNSEETTRRNLAQRVERVLESLEGAKRQPTASESYYLFEAIALLESHSYARGEEAALKAERSAGFELTGWSYGVETLSVAGLRDALNRVLKGKN
jgi:hypothetical protein